MGKKHNPSAVWYEPTAETVIEYTQDRQEEKAGISNPTKLTSEEEVNLQELKSKENELIEKRRNLSKPSLAKKMYGHIKEERLKAIEEVMIEIEKIQNKIKAFERGINVR